MYGSPKKKEDQKEEWEITQAIPKESNIHNQQKDKMENKDKGLPSPSLNLTPKGIEEEDDAFVM